MLGCRTIPSTPSLLEPFTSAAGVLQQCSDLPAVFIVANPKKLTVEQFCIGRKEQSCPWPAENLSPCAAPRSTLGANVRGILWAAILGWSCHQGSDMEKS